MISRRSAIFAFVIVPCAGPVVFAQAPAVRKLNKQSLAPDAALPAT